MTTPRPERSRTTRIIDLVVGIALTVIAALIGLVMLAYVTQLGQLSAVCTGLTPEGTRCDPGFLGAMGVLGTAIVVLGWFLPAGFLVVRAIQRRLVFFLPVVALVVMYAGYLLVSALLGAAYLPPA
jgi:hypothetical protein